MTIAPRSAIIRSHMLTEGVQLDEIESALGPIFQEHTKVMLDVKKNQRDFSTDGFRMQIIGPGTDVERLHTELGIPQTVLRDLLNKFGFSKDSKLNVVFHQEKPGFIAFQSPEIDLKKPATYISYTQDTNGEMILGIEGLKDGTNLRGQYKADPLDGGDFKLTAWNCIDKLKAPRLEKYVGQKKMPIPTRISLRPMSSM